MFWRKPISAERRIGIWNNPQQTTKMIDKDCGVSSPTVTQYQKTNFSLQIEDSL